MSVEDLLRQLNENIQNMTRLQQEQYEFQKRSVKNSEQKERQREQAAKVNPKLGLAQALTGNNVYGPYRGADIFGTVNTPPPKRNFGPPTGDPQIPLRASLNAETVTSPSADLRSASNFEGVASARRAREEDIRNAQYILGTSDPSSPEYMQAASFLETAHNEEIRAKNREREIIENQTAGQINNPLMRKLANYTDLPYVWEQMRTGRMELSTGVGMVGQRLMKVGIPSMFGQKIGKGVQYGVGALGVASIIGLGLPRLARFSPSNQISGIYSPFEQMALNMNQYRSYGQEAGYTGSGGFLDLMATNTSAYTQFIAQDLFGSGAHSLIGASEAVTEGKLAQYRGFKRGLNPFDSLSVEEAQQINQGVLQRGYTRRTGGIEMENAVTDLVKRTAIDSAQALSILDLAVRRLNVSAADARDIVEDFGTKSKSAFKSVSEYTKEVEDVASKLRSQGLSGTQALELGQQFAGLPQLSGTDIFGMAMNQPTLSLIQGNLAQQYQGNVSAMATLSTGNVFSLGGGQPAFQGLFQVIKERVDAFRAAGMDKQASYALAATVLGQTPEQVQRLYENGDRLVAMSKAKQQIDKMYSGFDKWAKRDVNKELDKQFGAFQQDVTNKNISGKDFFNPGKDNLAGRLASPVLNWSADRLGWDGGGKDKPLLSQFDFNWDEMMGVDLEDDPDLVNKVKDALKAGKPPDDPIARSYYEMIVNASRSPEKFKELFALYGSKIGGQSIESFSKRQWSKYVTSAEGKTKMPQLRRELTTYLKGMAKENLGLTPEKQRAYIDQVMGGHLSPQELQDKLERDTAQRKAELEGRMTYVDLAPGLAQKLLKLIKTDKPGSNSSQRDSSEDRNVKSFWESIF